MKKTTNKLELVCPAGSPAALYAAVDAGADTVYCGFRDQTNARNFPGLNFNLEELIEGVAYAHKKDTKVFLAINTYPSAGKIEIWKNAIDKAAKADVDAIILADIGLLDYANKTYPELNRHLSVQAAASNKDAIKFYVDHFAIKRLVLPRVLSIPEIKQLNSQISVETEIFAFGGLCIMTEGRCSLSGHVTGESPNMCGVCSPASAVSYEQRGNKMVSKLDKYIVNEFNQDEPAGYPTLCKGRFEVNGSINYLFEEPASLNIIDKLPDIIDAGVHALKIEGRQRGKAYVANITKAFKNAIDKLSTGNYDYNIENLKRLSEGQNNTSGAYEKRWK